MSTTFRYVCLNTSCGHVVLTTRAPAASRRCAMCGGLMVREPA